MDVKTKLENYRAIFNTSPKNSDVEKKALGKIADLAAALPDDDKEKHEYMRVALDFFEGDDAVSTALFDKLLTLAPHVENKEEQLKTYRVLMRNKHCTDAAREQIATAMMDVLETV